MGGAMSATTPTQRPLRVAIACGGTGGHTFPGLATGRVLRARGHEVTILQAGRDIEAATLKGWDGPAFKTGARPIRPATLPAFLRSVARTWRFFGKWRPDAVLAMGSYASLPPVLAARLRGIPVVLHEANAVPGKAVAFLARRAAATAISFEESAKWLPRGVRVERTGLPVRTELLDQPPLDGFATEGGFTVLVTGGSQGAHAVNELASAALASLAAKRAIPGFRIIHQTGAADEAAVRERYRKAGADAQVFSFFNQMGGAMKVADYAIARAGAATCAELCLFGLPALLVPLPIAVRDHQYLNAKHLAEAGAAEVVRQEALDAAGLEARLLALASDRLRLDGMRAAARSLAAPDAAERLADLVCSLAETPR